MSYCETIGDISISKVGKDPTWHSKVGQFLANPRIKPLKAVIRGLQYLSGTKGYGLLLGGSLDVTRDNLADTLTTYSDSDYTDCPETRRSVCEYVTMLANTPISWILRKRHTVVLSTTEAAYIVLCHWIQEMIFLKLLLYEQEHVFTIILFSSIARAALKSARTPNFTGDNKYIHVIQRPCSQSPPWSWWWLYRQNHHGGEPWLYRDFCAWSQTCTSPSSKSLEIPMYRRVPTHEIIDISCLPNPCHRVLCPIPSTGKQNCGH